MHQGGDYQDLFLSHSLIINKLEGFFPKLCNLTPPPPPPYN